MILWLCPCFQLPLRLLCRCSAITCIIHSAIKLLYPPFIVGSLETLSHACMSVNRTIDVVCMGTLHLFLYLFGIALYDIVVIGPLCLHFTYLSNFKLCPLLLHRSPPISPTSSNLCHQQTHPHRHRRVSSPNSRLLQLRALHFHGSRLRVAPPTSSARSPWGLCRTRRRRW